MMRRDNRMYKEIRLGKKDQQGEERRRQEAYLQVTPFEVINVKFPSLLPSFPLPSLLHFSPRLLFSFAPAPSAFTLLYLLPLPVSPVYEGKFIGLPGAVSWRWPPLLKPQQGFALHMEQKEHSGHTGLFPLSHIKHDSTLTPPIIC